MCAYIPWHWYVPVSYSDQLWIFNIGHEILVKIGIINRNFERQQCSRAFYTNITVQGKAFIKKHNKNPKTIKKKYLKLVF